MQTDVRLLLTVTVPDQVTADFFDSSAANPPVLSPTDPSQFATKSQAASISLISFANSGAFGNIPLQSFGAKLDLSPLTYPSISDANVSLSRIQPTADFNTKRSEDTDLRASALEAFAESATFELEVAIRALPELPEEYGVCVRAHGVLCYCLLGLASCVTETSLTNAVSCTCRDYLSYELATPSL